MAPGLSVADFLARQNAAAVGPPWMAPWHGVTFPAAEGLDAAGWLTRLRCSMPSAAGTVDFVRADAPPPGEPYEAFIARTHTVPTRDNLHDLFNGLAWLRFPQAKSRMNTLHTAELGRPAREPGRRGRLRDALTVFDENGAVLHAPPALWEALRARAWRRLFVDLRPLWRQARLIVVGHALLEQLATAPRKPLTAHVLCADAPASADAVDAWLATALADRAWLQAKPYTPLPVLGIPGWWPANEAPDFYDDAGVFRPAPGELLRL